MKHLVLVSFLPFWVLVLYTLKKWPINKKHSFSMHGAASQYSYRLYSPIVAYCGITYFLFNYFWYIDALQLGVTYTIFMVIISLLQVFFALVPDRMGTLRTLHRNAANLWGVLLMLTFVITFFDAPLALLQRVVIIVTLFAMSLCALKIAGALEKSERYLPYQLLGIGVIHTGIILLTYLN